LQSESLLIPLIVGVFVFLFAIGLVHHHREVWRRMLAKGLNPSSKEYSYFVGQMRRRAFTSGLISLVGFLMILYAVATVYWPIRGLLVSLIGVMLLLLVVISMLASWDFFSVHRLLRLQQKRLAQSRADLVEAARQARIRKEQRDQTKTIEERQSESAIEPKTDQ
jgi:ABC-type multidrug transport system fused ATPase/permease subunit